MIKHRKHDETFLNSWLPRIIFSIIFFAASWWISDKLFNYETPYNPNKVAIQNAMWEIRMEEQAKEDSLHNRIERIARSLQK